MLAHLFNAFVATLVLGASGLQDDPVEVDKSRLQGSWVCVKVEIDGEAHDHGGLAEMKQVFEKDTLRFYRGGKHVGDVSFTIDPTTTPKAMDWTYDSPERLKGKTRRGIYRLDGDSLTICFNISADRKERPSRFETGSESGLFLHIYKRADR